MACRCNCSILPDRHAPIRATIGCSSGVPLYFLAASHRWTALPRAARPPSRSTPPSRPCALPTRLALGPHEIAPSLPDSAAPAIDVSAPSAGAVQPAHAIRAGDVMGWHATWQVYQLQRQLTPAHRAKQSAAGLD